jgi:hypothetical protein
MPAAATEPGAGEPGLTINNLDGILDGKDIYITSPNTKSIKNATHGVVGNTAVTVNNMERWVVIAVAYTTQSYDDRRDADGVMVKQYSDDAIELRIYAAGENPLGTNSLPTVDQDCIPILRICRLYNDTPSTIAAYTDARSTHANLDIDQQLLSVQDIRRVDRKVSSLYNKGSDSTTPNVTVESLVGQGGKVKIRGNQFFFVSRAIRRLKDSDVPDSDVVFEKTLSVNKTYFLRAQTDELGAIKAYVQQGSLPNSDGEFFLYPTNGRGVVDDLTGGEFPSTGDDLLLAKVVTGSAGTTPSLTIYSANEYFHQETVLGDYSTSPAYNVEITLPQPVGRDLDIDIRSSGESFTAVGPTSNHVHGHQEYFKVRYYNYESVAIEAKGKWCEKDGSNFLKVPSQYPYYRPGFIVTVRTKVRPV